MLVNIHQAKSNFSKLINQALNGEEIIIAKGGIPLIKLTPYNKEMPKRRGEQFKNIIKIPDDFDDPLPDDYLKSFYNKDL